MEALMAAGTAGAVIGYYVGRWTLLARHRKLQAACASLQSQVDSLKAQGWGRRG